MSNISIQKLNEILKEIGNITENDGDIFKRLADRAKGIAKNNFTVNSNYISDIEEIQKSIGDSLYGLRDRHIQKLIGIVHIMIDEIEITKSTEIKAPDNSNIPPSSKHTTPKQIDSLKKPRTKAEDHNTPRIFIVHGHDEEAKIKTARFIERLGFTPIILHEQASASKTIIEKIEEYSNVGFGIILYTPCDIGAKQTNSPLLKPRARQNVVFEHGYLIGKIGRGNVCALVKGEVETPNDISGVVYISMDDADGWHVKIAKELRNSGYSVDMNNVI